jgi:hypothetical protein
MIEASSPSEQLPAVWTRLGGFNRVELVLLMEVSGVVVRVVESSAAVVTD